MNSEHVSIAYRLLDLFRGRADHVAVGDVRDGKNTFAPCPLKSPLKPEWLAQRHLGKEKCLGFYLMTPESKVFCTCADFDNKPEHPDPEWKTKAEAVHLWLAKAGLSPLTEISQSGIAAHVWLFFEEATEAWIPRAWWRLVSERSKVPIPEVYPRQDVLSGKGIGNLVRYPLWNNSRFTDPEDDWAILTPGKALAGTKKTTGPDLQAMALEMGKALERGNVVSISHEVATVRITDGTAELSPRVQQRLNRKGSLLNRRWNGDVDGLNDKSRSALVMAIATELMRVYTPESEAKAALRYWCKENEYEKANERFIDRVASKAYEFCYHRMEERSTTTSTMQAAVMGFIGTLKSGTCGYIRSGLSDLDDSIDGVAFGEMAVIASRPGHGKSAFCLQWLDNAALAGTTCLLISEEMSSHELGKRGLTYLSPMDASRWGPDTAQLLEADAAEHYRPRAPIYLVESCNSIERVEDVVDQHVAMNGVQLVAVDYLQLLGGRGQKKYDQVTDVSRRLKQTARRNNVGLLAACQLNREIDKRTGTKEPQLSDLRESGQLEQDADLAIFLQWPARYDPSAIANYYIVYVKKRRNGPVRQPKIETLFEADRQKIGGGTFRCPFSQRNGEPVEERSFAP